MIRFIVPGTPVAKGRPRIATRGGFARAYTPQKTVAYEGLIAMAAQEAMAGYEPLAGAVSLNVTAVFAIPKSWSRKKAQAALWHVGKPDGDNLLKAVGDGLNGVTWKDDSQVASARIVKRYGPIPGLTVEVEEL